jgi:hypothetical protein
MLRFYRAKRRIESNPLACAPDNLDCKEAPALDGVTPAEPLLAGMGRYLQKREF